MTYPNDRKFQKNLAVLQIAATAAAVICSAVIALGIAITSLSSEANIRQIGILLLLAGLGIFFVMIYFIGKIIRKM